MAALLAVKVVWMETKLKRGNVNAGKNETKLPQDIGEYIALYFQHGNGD